jgi:S-adenosylhomocysteine hydrolase
MNGASTQKIVFHDDKGTSESTKGTRAGTNAPAPLRVEVVNGTASDTEYFYGDNGRQGSDEKRPVVVAIQSSDTRVVGGNKHTVVTGITAVGRGDAKSANGSGQKVTAVVSPQPKRPEYQPDAH